MERISPKGSQASDDRRRAPRVPLLVRVECKTPRTYVLGYCGNISETGMLVKCRETFDVAQAVTVRFMLPPIATGTAVETGGIVVRAQAGEFMAVEFVRLRATLRSAISRYIEQNAHSANVASGR
jgi:hypothetical protein